MGIYFCLPEKILDEDNCSLFVAQVVFGMTQALDMVQPIATLTFVLILELGNLLISWKQYLMHGVYLCHSLKRNNVSFYNREYDDVISIFAYFQITCHPTVGLEVTCICYLLDIVHHLLHRNSMPTAFLYFQEGDEADGFLSSLPFSIRDRATASNPSSLSTYHHSLSVFFKKNTHMVFILHSNFDNYFFLIVEVRIYFLFLTQYNTLLMSGGTK
ncbi:hypothetical protein ACJX0J_007091 [Zea mays]